MPLEDRCSYRLRTDTVFRVLWRELYSRRFLERPEHRSRTVRIPWLGSRTFFPMDVPAGTVVSLAKVGIGLRRPTKCPSERYAFRQKTQATYMHPCRQRP